MEEYKLRGWVSRDEYYCEFSNLYFSQQKPKRALFAEKGFGMWGECVDFMALPSDMFPQLTYNDEPIEVEIIIQIKKINK